MRAKRTIALLASPFVAAAALTFTPAALSPAAADPVHTSSLSVPDQPAKPPPPLTEKDGAKDGRAAGRTDGPDCDYKVSWSPRSTNSKYMSGYRTAYERNYNKLCDED
jgi:hypothetical protein